MNFLQLNFYLFKVYEFLKIIYIFYLKINVIEEPKRLNYDNEGRCQSTSSKNPTCQTQTSQHMSCTSSLVLMQNSTDTLVDEASFVNKKLVVEKGTSIKLNTNSQHYMDEVFMLNQHKLANNTGLYLNSSF